MGTEQCAVVVSLVVSLMFSNLKLWSRWFRVGLRIGIDGVVGIGHGIAPVSRGTTGSDRECWLTDIPVRLALEVSERAWMGRQVRHCKALLAADESPTGNHLPQR